MALPRLDALLVLPLLLAGGWLGRLADDARATPRPPPGVAGLLGGFSAIAVQVLWIRGDRALQADRMDEALYYFGLIHGLEPQLVGATDYFANEITANLGDREPDPVARANLTMLAVRMLDRTVEDNPGRAEAHVARGMFLLARLGPFPARARAFESDRRTSVFAAARVDFQKALDANPASREGCLGLAVSSRLRALELFTAAAPRQNERALRIAGDIFRDARSAYDRLMLLQKQAWTPEDGTLVQQHEEAMRAEAIAWIEFLSGPLDDVQARYREFNAAAGAPSDWPPPW